MSLRKSLRALVSRRRSADHHFSRRAAAGRGRLLRLEPLEDRTLLAVFTWDGGGGDDNWTTAANWAGDVAPSAGDDLVFAGATRQTNNNDFLVFPWFNSITLSNGGFSLQGNAAVLFKGADVLVNTAGTNTIALDITLSPPLAEDPMVRTDSGELTLSGILAGADGLRKTGAGTANLTGINIYTGQTTVAAGRLNVNGSTAAGSNVVVQNTGTLGGTGTVHGTVTVQAGGTVAPGVSPGVLHTGAVTLQDNSTFSVEIGGTTPGNAANNHDQLDVTGTVTIGSNVTLSLAAFGGFTPAASQQFILIDNDGADAITGTFQGLAEGTAISNFLGSGLTARITYAGGDGNDLAIVVNGPATVNLVGAIAGPEDFTLKVVGPNLQLKDGAGNLLMNRPLAGVLAPLVINSQPGQADMLVIDSGGDGNPIPQSTLPAPGVTFNGDGDETLEFAGGTFDDVTVIHTAVNAGSVDLDPAGGADQNFRVSFTGLAPLVIGGTAANTVIDLTQTGVQNPDVRLTNDGPAVGDPDGVAHAGASAIHGSTFEFTQFNNPTASLEIKLGPNGDTITVEDLDPLFVAPRTVIITGGAGHDTVNIESSQTTGGLAYASLTVNGGGGSDTINVGAPTIADPAGSLDDIKSPLFLNGNGAPGDTDTVWIFDDNDASVNTYTITGTTLDRAGAAQITYGTVENLILYAGTSGDTINVEGTIATTPLTVNAGAGNDTITFGTPGNSLDAILGTVTVHGDAGAGDQLNIDDQGDADASTYTITAATVDRTGAAQIVFDTMEGLTLNAGTNGDAINVEGTTAGTPLTVNAGAGNDTITVGSPGNSLDTILGTVTVNGDAGASDQLNVDDQGDADASSYTITSTTVDRTGAATITYATVEGLTVNAGTGGDTINVNSTSAAATTAINANAGDDTFNINASTLAGTNDFSGGDGDDAFNVNITGAGGLTAPLTLHGNANDFGAGAGGRDEVTLTDAFGLGAVVLTMTYTGGAGGSELTVAGPLIVNTLTTDTMETIDCNAFGTNDSVTVVGSPGDDLISVAPINANRALVFNNSPADANGPFDGPPQVFANRFPGVSGGSVRPDLDLSGLVTVTGLTIQDAGATTGDRLYVYGESQNGLSDGNTFDPFGFGAGLLLPAVAAPGCRDTITVTDTKTTIDGHIQVNYNTTDFVQATPAAQPAVVINAGDESAPPATPGVDVSDIIALTASTAYRFQINGGAPAPPDVVPPDGDRLTVASPGADISIFSDKASPPNVTIQFAGAATLPFGYSSIENLFLDAANRTVNLIGDNNDPTVDQNDHFVVVGKDVDGDPTDGGFREMEVKINGSAPIVIVNVQFLNVYGDDQNPAPGTASVGPNHIDTLELTPYADSTPRGWGVEVFFHEGNPAQADGAQQDLLVYHTSAGLGGGGSVSERIVVQPSGPEAGEIRVTNAVDGSAIVTIRYVANLDLIVHDDDGSTSDTDTLVLRGTSPSNPVTSGNESVTVDLSAAGDVANPKIVVADAGPPTPASPLLYRLRNFTGLGAIWFELLEGDDAISVLHPHNGSSTVRVHVDGGDGNDRLTVRDDGIGDIAIYRKGHDQRSGTITVNPVGGLPAVVFAGIEDAQVQPINPLTGGTGSDGVGRVVVFSPDPFEQNNSRFNATPFDLLSRAVMLPSIEPGKDEDWYSFVAPESSSFQFKLLFEKIAALSNLQPGLPGDGDLKLEVYNASGTPIGTPVTITGGEAVTANLERNATYYARVKGKTDPAVNLYDLEIVNNRETFDDDWADDFDPQSGVWTIDYDGKNARYCGVARSNGNAISLYKFPPPDNKSIEVTFEVQNLVAGQRWSNAFIVFDYAGPTDFKFAGAFVGLDKWVIGRSANNADGYVNDAAINERIDANIDYRMKVELLKNSPGAGQTTVKLWVHNGTEWVLKVSRTYSELFEPKVGLLTMRGTAYFDNFVDPDPGAQGGQGAGQTNRAPVAVGDAATTDEDTPITLNVLANDSDLDGDALGVWAVTQGAWGQVVKNADGSLTYKPRRDFHGTDSFAYSVSDGKGGSASAAVQVTVRPVNDPPVAGDDTAKTPEATPVKVNLLGNDSDPDGDSLSVVAASDGAHGTVTNHGDGTVTYAPNPGFKGSDAFTYTLSDGHGGTSTATARVTVGNLSIQEDFNDGAADNLKSQTGKWSVSGNRYLAERQTEQQNVISTLEISDPLPAKLDLRVTFNADPKTSTRWSNAFIVFDYKSPTDFKFAGAFVGIQTWAIGRMTPRGYELDQSLSRQPIDPGRDYRLQVLLDGQRATLVVDGVTKLSHQFADSLQDGKLGLATLRGIARFDDLSVTEL